jgi:hypothetical protein
LNDLKKIIQNQYPNIARIDIEYDYVSRKTTDTNAFFNEDKRAILASYSDADIMIIDDLTYNAVNESGMFLDINTLINGSSPGITLTYLPIIDKLGIVGSSEILVIMQNSKKLNNAIQGVKALLKN